MRVLVLSDTHGRTDRIQQAVRQAGRFDLLVHAGDHADDVLESFPHAVAVCGNCDDPSLAAVEQEVDLLGLKALVAHGHTLNVKTSPLPLLYRAAEAQADIAIYGHTHTPTLVEEEGRIFLNPGSLSYPRGFTVCTYCVIELTRRDAQGQESEVEAQVQFYTLDGNPVPGFDLKKSWRGR
ncbi:hypothetical protein EL26_00005 [Tumebacillus flagellatus]|uniref:Phosphoesterase n=2 Tax=Tumebacillus flagellatus TaxID=1157490 RepID=A0A074LWJ3_9BACL|nr:hypothetical protein EL26_00005 [Tumebacillus flagellatus]